MNMLSPHTVDLLNAYNAHLPQLEQLAEQVSSMLLKALREQNIQLNTFERRVKTEDSLTGKLEKKGISIEPSTILPTSSVSGL